MKAAARSLWPSFWAMLKQQLLILTRYPANLAANFLLVLITVIVVILAVRLFAPLTMALRLRSLTLYGFVIYIFLSHTLWTVGLSLQKEKAEGTLVTLYLTPASRLLALLARSGVALSWTTIAAGLGLILAQAVTGPLDTHQPGLALAILFLTASGLVGLGLAIAGLALHFGESMEIVANILEFSLIGLCAFFFPFSVLPPVLQHLSRLIPLSYAVDAFRTVAMGEPRPELLDLRLELAIVALTGVAGPLLGYAVYRLCERRARQQGLL